MEPQITLILGPPGEEAVETVFSIRPFAIECLKKANENFEIAVFTAGHDWYATPIIDYLDPSKELI